MEGGSEQIIRWQGAQKGQGIVGVGLTGQLLEASTATHSDLTSAESWRPVFFIPWHITWITSWWPYLVKTYTVQFRLCNVALSISNA
ncbi:hypothetical protein FRX31_007780 [Thalictrum thalictroides]|uniref:Uncharacterized protein n=1 Tax=Thalictrum thalictroides TaxID=46969 RepID=A0A7J6X1C1_THATH|nr:hypothetical protein FRX31_007780 [Thalictrum thalictroides]